MGETRYYQATSVHQAADYLKEYKDTAKLLAGGTDIMVLENQYALPADTVFVGIEDIPELKRIALQEDGIHIGSMVTAAELTDDPLIKQYLNALYLAAKESASPQVRNRATIGGNVGTASPSGDLLTALIALDAVAVIEGTDGEKRIDVKDIPVFVKKTCLDPTDIIKEFVIALPEEREDSFFIKMGKRKAMTISIVSMAAKVKLSEDLLVIEKVNISAGACAPTPKRLTALEKAATGCIAEDTEFEAISEEALKDVSPITDMRATAWYRKELVKVFAQRVLSGAVAKIREA